MFCSSTTQCSSWYSRPSHFNREAAALSCYIRHSSAVVKIISNNSYNFFSFFYLFCFFLHCRRCNIFLVTTTRFSFLFCFISPLQQFWQAEPLSECIPVPNTFFVFIGDHSSQHCALNCGIPQGSILGPVFFCVWPLCHIRQGDNISFHCYADDMQL